MCTAAEILPCNCSRIFLIVKRRSSKGVVTHSSCKAKQSNRRELEPLKQIAVNYHTLWLAYNLDRGLASLFEILRGYNESKGECEGLFYSVCQISVLKYSINNLEGSQNAKVLYG